MMKTTAVLWLAIGLASPALSQSQPAQSAGVHEQTVPASQSKLDPAKEADIRRLLEVAGAKEMALQIMGGMENNIKPLLTASFPPGEYREKLIDLFFAKFHSKIDMQHFVDLAVPVYDKYLSHEEIKDLTRFYQTPLGRKMLTIMPKLSLELQEAGQKWGQAIGRDSMMEVFAEHPELQKALEEARAATQQH
jgi:hypothetical protein